MLGWSRRRRATALTPSRSGMWRSITIASGSSSSASSIAARPSAALPTTPSSGCRSISGWRASTNGPSSSASSTRIVPVPGSADGIARKLALLATPLQAQRLPVAVIGAALDLGSGRRGVDMGPSAIRYAGLDARLTQLGVAVVDRGNVGTAVAEAVAAGKAGTAAPEAADEGGERLRYLEPILKTCAHIADLVAEATEHGHLPLV